MKGRGSKGAPSADLLVCFPSRAHLNLMPKPICSPARPSEPNKRHHNHHHHLKKSTTRSGGGSQGSPLLWAKTTKSMNNSDISEPTSPKVTCAGQIKVRPKTSASSCKNWQSVMEEIEKIHNRKQRKSPSWVEALGLKKDVMQFLTCLRSIKFDFRCFRAFPTGSEITSDEEEEEEEDDETEFQENHHLGLTDSDDSENSRAVFSKWFMVLQENQSNNGLIAIDDKIEAMKTEHRSFVDDESEMAASVPPPNALLLMRCRSAPAKNWLEEDEDSNHEKREMEEANNKAKLALEEEKKKKKQSMLVMKYDTDFYKLSCDIAKETWIGGGLKDPFSRSRSWKR